MTWGTFSKNLSLAPPPADSVWSGRWYDAVEKGDALRYGGFQDLMINKLDALSHNEQWSGSLKICVAYEDAQGNRVNHVPRDESYRRGLKAIYETYEGWAEDISGIRHFADLPVNAQRYVSGHG